MKKISWCFLRSLFLLILIVAGLVIASYGLFFSSSQGTMRTCALTFPSWLLMFFAHGWTFLTAFKKQGIWETSRNK